MILLNEVGMPNERPILVRTNVAELVELDGKYKSLNALTAELKKLEPIKPRGFTLWRGDPFTVQVDELSVIGTMQNGYSLGVKVGAGEYHVYGSLEFQ